MHVDDLDDVVPDRIERPVPLGRLRPWVEWFGPVRLTAAVVAIVAIVAGGWWLLRAPSPPTEAGLPFASAGPTTTVAGGTAGVAAPVTTSTAVRSPVVVHVAGAVARPGVYELAAGARVQAALDAAGGPAPGADAGALNLAAPLGDGERVYVPTVGETVPPAPPVAASGPGTTVAGPIDLNRASAGDLDELPGIGPTTAAAIVAHRDQHGPFASVEDLEAVRGIGPAKLEALRGLVAV